MAVFIGTPEDQYLGRISGPLGFGPKSRGGAHAKLLISNLTSQDLDDPGSKYKVQLCLSRVNPIRSGIGGLSPPVEMCMTQQASRHRRS